MKTIKKGSRCLMIRRKLWHLLFAASTDIFPDYPFKTRKQVAMPVVAFICMLVQTTVAAQQQPSRKELLNALLKQQVGVVQVQEITMGAGQTAPKHRHPCPVAGYVVSGSVLFQMAGEPARILKQGAAFFEPKHKTILHFDNASKKEPVTFVAFYLKEGNEPNIELLKQ